MPIREDRANRCDHGPGWRAGIEDDDIRRVAYGDAIVPMFHAPPSFTLRTPQWEAIALAEQMVLMEDGQPLQVGALREVFEKPASSFNARFTGGYNVLKWRDGLIAARVDLCSLTSTDGGSDLPSRVTNIEYRSPSVRVGLRTTGGTGFAALLPDVTFRHRFFSAGEAAALSRHYRLAHPFA